MTETIKVRVTFEIKDVSTDEIEIVAETLAHNGIEGINSARKARITYLEASWNQRIHMTGACNER